MEYAQDAEDLVAWISRRSFVGVADDFLEAAVPTILSAKSSQRSQSRDDDLADCTGRDRRSNRSRPAPPEVDFQEVVAKRIPANGEHTKVNPDVLSENDFLHYPDPAILVSAKGDDHLNSTCSPVPPSRGRIANSKVELRINIVSVGHGRTLLEY